MSLDCTVRAGILPRRAAESLMTRVVPIRQCAVPQRGIAQRIRPTRFSQRARALLVGALSARLSRLAIGRRGRPIGSAKVLRIGAYSDDDDDGDDGSQWTMRPPVVTATRCRRRRRRRQCHFHLLEGNSNNLCKYIISPLHIIIITAQAGFSYLSLFVFEG